MQAQPASKCPQCGEPVLPTDSHCMGCGRALRAAPSPAAPPPVPRAAAAPRGDQDMARRHAATMDAMHHAGLAVRVILVLVVLAGGVFVYYVMRRGLGAAYGEFCSASVKANQACRIALATDYAGNRPLMQGSVLLGIPEGAITRNDKITLARLENPFGERLTLASGALTIETQPLGAASVTAASDAPPSQPLELTIELEGASESDFDDLDVLLLRKRREGGFAASTETDRVETTMIRGFYSRDKNKQVSPDSNPKSSATYWLQFGITDWGHYYVYRTTRTVDSTKYPPWKSPWGLAP